ncbi:PA0069 family radical SAM protein [Oleiharenicola lentus]|uniref:PA0069 family radical SAM protein n=1 Tax=Oleiharenicola lentus TaxID=2508720 RepID=UPI003F676C4E
MQPNTRITGRGPNINPPNRFDPLIVAPDESYGEFDEFTGAPIERDSPKTKYYFDASESIITKNESPDLGRHWGLNGYRGCSHGCSYCFARPYHEYLGWSSGIDFETKILVKLRAPELLRSELESLQWIPEPIMMSGATDCYQPAERHFRITRQCLEVMAEFRQPVSIITKNFLVTRDIDLLQDLAKYNCVSVHISVTSLDANLAGKLEPRAARPEHRLRAIRMLSDAGIPVVAMVAPVIPGLTDHEIPAILDAVAQAGAKGCSWVMLRLPHAVKDVFLSWLEDHVPGKKEKIISRIQDVRDGKLYDSNWGTRMRGTGIFAEQIAKIFEVSARRAGLTRERPQLSCTNFRRRSRGQLELF